MIHVSNWLMMNGRYELVASTRSSELEFKKRCVRVDSYTSEDGKHTYVSHYWEDRTPDYKPS